MVGFGGFIGASLRYVVSSGATKWFGNYLPYGTLIVNILGGLLIGLIMELSVSSSFITPQMRLFLTTGMLGGLTTFSTFSYETVSFIMNANYILAVTNTFLNLLLSFGGVFLGKYIAGLFA